MKEQERALSRRQFVGGAAGTLGAMMLAGGKTARAEPAAAILTAPQDAAFLDRAPDGPPLKAGVVGCGGRGTGAAEDFLDAGPNLQITALGDVFADRLQSCRETLAARGQEIPDSRCFVGFDAYQKVIASGVNVVLLATPPHFRPEHFAACVAARKHVFMEKPVAVDPVGIRSVISSARKGQTIGLCAVTGTQRRHQRDYVAAYQRIKAGTIGELVAGYCYWNQDQLWFRTREEGWSDMEAMLRDWVNWCWLSGDHIVEQHVHNIDVINWFLGKYPARAVACGARHRRPTGDQYDMFSVDFVYDDGRHLSSMCRQISGCENNVSEFVVGTKGASNCRNKIYKLDGTALWEYDYPKDASGQPTGQVAISPYKQEHIDLVTAIRTGKPINEAETTANSTLVAIMGRIAAYTGRQVTWEEAMTSDLRLGPTTYEMGPVNIEAEIPVPGQA
ncbi:MAG: Gfo/Idh/MocA family oxidoreductase [Planctomycetota bacterium]